MTQLRSLAAAILGVPTLLAAQVDPILHYTFDDGANPTANLGSLGPAYNGSVGPGIVFAPFGPGLAIDFDSVDDAQVQPQGDENAFDIADTDFSVVATVVTTNHEPGAPGSRFVVNKEKLGSNDGWSLTIRRDSGEVSFALAANGTSIGVLSLTPVNDGAPHEIIGARAGDLLLVAIDGVVEAFEPIPATFGSTAQNDFELSIGGRARFTGSPTTGPNDEFLGTIDDVLIYDVAIIDAPCYADCDNNTALDIFDFLCFQDLFAMGDPAADCDGNTTLDIFDFLCFQDAFATGCP